MAEYTTHPTIFSELIKKHDLINNPVLENYTKDLITIIKDATLKFLKEEITEIIEEHEQRKCIEHEEIVIEILELIDRHLQSKKA